MTRLTPEHIAEIKARHEARKQSRPGTQRTAEELVEFYNSAHEDRERLISHIESDGWQTMETAPTEGYFLAWSPDHPHLCMPYEAKQFHRMRRDGTPRHLSSNHITHWRPLPAPPETKEG